MYLIVKVISDSILIGGHFQIKTTINIPVCYIC